VRTHTRQKAHYGSCGEPRSAQADSDSDSGPRQRSTHYLAHYLSRSGPKGDANSDFTRALSDRIGDYAIDARDRQQQRNGRKQGKEPRVGTRGSEGTVQSILYRTYVINRKARI
jgi:hypothetical protein